MREIWTSWALGQSPDTVSYSQQTNVGSVQNAVHLSATWTTAPRERPLLFKYVNVVCDPVCPCVSVRLNWRIWSEILTANEDAGKTRTHKKRKLKWNQNIYLFFWTVIFCRCSTTKSICLNLNRPKHSFFGSSPRWNTLSCLLASLWSMFSSWSAQIDPSLRPVSGPGTHWHGGQWSWESEQLRVCWGDDRSSSWW